jgi:DNA uptake protein ComE-like DNA-binding protein
MRSLWPIARTIVAVAVAVTCAHLIAAQRPQAAPGIQHAVQAAGDLLDINTASPRQLNALPGFGPAYTRRVIAGRPYMAKNQLVTRGVLPSEAYERVSALIIAHRPAR